MRVDRSREPKREHHPDRVMSSARSRAETISSGRHEKEPDAG
jgi:hypothetical protein